MAAALLLGSVLTGCGGGDGDQLTLQQLYQRLDEVFDDVDEQFEALEEDCQATDASEEAQSEAFRCFFDASCAIFDESLDEIGALNPPAEAAAALAEYLDSGADVSQFVEKFLEGPTDAGSASDLDEFLEDPELEAASERFDDACSALQVVADENEIDVDLDCES